MGSKQHHFVLVHGAGHGAWCWIRIVAGLEKERHRVTTLDLMGAGESPLNADDCTSFEQYNQPLEDLFKSFPEGEKVILVGHSLGGLSLTYMSEHFPKNISVAVYLTALMPPPGLNLLHLTVDNPEFLPDLKYQYTYKVEGGPPTAQTFSHADLKELFYNKCSPEDVTTALKHMRTYPSTTMFFVPMNGTKENYGSVPKVSVVTLDDKVVIPAFLRKVNELNPPNEVIEIHADHSLFFSADDVVVKHLNTIAAKYDTRE